MSHGALMDGEVATDIALPPQTPRVFASHDPVEVLRHVQLTPRIVEDYRPVTECLEWRLSQNHWRTTGADSFLRSEVPYTITSSGTLSAQAARLLHANCLESPPRGPIRLLETGAGTGLFARLFLEEFERLCARSGNDFYSLIEYYVTDGSRQSVDQWIRFGVFEGKPVILGVANGADPLLVVRADSEEPLRVTGVRAVFANYVIDSMPGTVLRKSADGPEELHVRTHLSAEPTSVKTRFDASLEDVARMAAASDPKLLDLLSVLEFETAFLPVSRHYPYMEEALTFGHDWPRVVLNFGAIEYTECLLQELDPDGFVLINDYGMTQPSESTGLGFTQRFGPTTAMGVNFPFLTHLFASHGARTHRPTEDERLPLHPLMIAKRSMPATERRFQETFSWDAFSDMNAPQELARNELAAGRLEQVGKAYEKALEVRPRDWALLGEIAEFLLRHAADYEAGRKMAETALSLNPWYSAWLWNLLGDALFALNRFAEAHEVYVKAQQMSANDVRTALNLGYTFWELGQPAQALQSLARGLAEDGSGQFHARLLEKQGQILAALSQQHGQQQEWLMRRAARLSAG